MSEGHNERIQWCNERVRVWRRRKIAGMAMFTIQTLFSLPAMITGPPALILFNSFTSLFLLIFVAGLAAKYERRAMMWREQWIRISKDPDNSSHYMNHFKYE